MGQTLDVALIQTRTPATASAGLAHVEPLIRRAAAEGARFILTPEGTNLLEQRRDRRDRVLADQDDDVAVRGLSALAAELGVWLLVGSAIVRSGHADDDRAANRSLLIDDRGRIVKAYDKLHVFDVDLEGGETYRESRVVRPGDAAAVADTPWGRLGLTVCYDLRFPHLFRQLAKAGASMIAVPAAFTVPTGRAHWETLLRARAIETSCFILAPAQGGEHEDGRRTWGHSTIVGPWGEVLARAENDTPCVLHAKLDMDAVDTARRAVPQLLHDREFRAAVMIRYALKCEADHPFEAWFGSSSDYDDQAARGLVECPFCGSHGVSKQIMAPAVAGVRKAGPAPEGLQSMMMHAAREVRDHVERNFDYVGDAFAREARDIHEGRSEKREIYGEATPADVKKLKDDGVPCAPLPALPPDPAKAH